ncbi:MAG: N-acetyltransferase [Phenylobacterium zucineum]|nr:MAG: N-acetyltransferase [Phenylobacterium zucineum]
MTSSLRDTGNRFEMDEQGQTCWADYRRKDHTLVIDHVESPVALRGTGASGRLMAALAVYARDQNLKITPICTYAAAWLQRSDEFRDLII